MKIWTKEFISLGNKIYLAACSEALRLLVFRNFEEALMDLAKQVDSGKLERMNGKNAILEEACTQLEEYFSGQRKTFNLPLNLSGSDFQRQVWKSLMDIPYGETISYSEQARRLGRPSAVRAVAGSNGRNPISIIVPCHRVIGKSGSLTGYGGGLERKRELLAVEGIRIAN